MITDAETNQLYITDTLAAKLPTFARDFELLLEQHGITPRLIPGTNDIWCRDFMPVQVKPGKLVGFTFNPAYLLPPEHAPTRTDNHRVCDLMGLQPEWTDLVLDGGNLVKEKNKVIVTDSIYKENPGYGRKELREKLRHLLEVDELIVIPKQPYDFTGHADGMVRFLDEHTVLLNDYQHESEAFKQRLHKALRKQGLEIELLPYGYEYSKKGNETAIGIYINFLLIGNLLVVPQFWLLTDEEALKRLQQLYPGATIATINANRAAQHGGVLNCLTWTVQE